MSAQANEIQPGWPRWITLSQLKNGESIQRLYRRDEIQKRRLVLKALQKLFKCAAGRCFDQGHGFWIGIQHWFVLGFCRDVQEEDLDIHEGMLLSETIGPPYYHLIPTPSRYYFGRIMASLDLYLIFVEDGVGYRRLKRVIQVLFEKFDIYGERERAKEWHFREIPGLCVIIHDFSMGDPFESQVYPEPDYKELGRGRILHIFKDRQEEDEPSFDPFDLTRQPITLIGV